MSPSAIAESEVASSTERFERIPINQLVASKTNPRTHFPDEYLAQLANSITEKGVIEPIVVRQVDAGSHRPMRFEIVAGECRYRASKLAGLTHLPAVVRLYTDEQVLEVQLIENVQRHDLRPLEQAKGYRALIAANPTKHTAATIAIRVGMSEAWVWDRLKLLDLIPEAKQLLEQDRMSGGHAILIARLKPADQARVINPEINRSWSDGLWQADHAGLEWDEDAPENAKRKPGKYDGLKAVSIRELDRWIADHVRFDVKHAAKAVPLEFAETAARVDEAVAKPGRGKKVIPISFSHHVQHDARDAEERTYGLPCWERADGQEKSKTCEHSVLGVVAAGSTHYGKAFEVCVARDKCRVHFGDVIKQREKNQQLREAGKGKQAAKNEKRVEDRWQDENRKQQEEYKRWQALRPHAVAAAVAKTKAAKLTNAVLRRVVGMLDVDTKDLEKALGGPITTVNFSRALDVVDILERDNTREYFKPIVKKYKLDLAKIEKDLEAKAAPAKKSAAA